MSETKQSPKREQILSAALDIFSEKGFHKAKIEDIASTAGIGKGTVYEYFRSKEELFRELIIEGMTDFYSSLRQNLEQERTSRGKLMAFVRQNLEIGRHYRPMAKIALMETSVLDDSFRFWLIKMHTQSMELIEDIIKEGIGKGELRPVNIPIFSRFFYGGLGGLSNPFSDTDINNLELENIVEDIVDYFLKGIEV